MHYALLINGRATWHNATAIHSSSRVQTQLNFQKQLFKLLYIHPRLISFKKNLYKYYSYEIPNSNKLKSLASFYE